MFRITREMLKEKGACADGYRQYCEAFPKDTYPDGVEYQELLNACAENDRDDFAMWLLNAFGRTDDVLEIEGDYQSEKSLFVCGSLRVTGSITCKGVLRVGGSIKAGWSIETGRYIKAGWSIEAGEYIEAGWYIEAGRYIKAGGSIKAGWYIKAGEYIEVDGYIEAGDKYGIYAGILCRLDSKYRTVKAKVKPDNLMCGEFVQG